LPVRSAIKITGKIYSWQNDRHPLERQAGYFSWLLTDISHAKEFRLF